MIINVCQAALPKELLEDIELYSKVLIGRLAVEQRHHIILKELTGNNFNESVIESFFDSNKDIYQYCLLTEEIRQFETYINMRTFYFQFKNNLPNPYIEPETGLHFYTELNFV